MPAAGIDLPPEPTPLEPTPVVDIAPLTGTYTRLGNTVDVTTSKDGGLQASTTFALPRPGAPPHRAAGPTTLHQ